MNKFTRLSGICERFARRIGILCASCFLVLSFPLLAAAQAPAPAPTAPDATPAIPPADSAAPEGGRRHRQNQDDNGPRPVLGRIASIQDGVIKITRPDGSEQKVNITAKTEFRKDRE